MEPQKSFGTRPCAVILVAPVPLRAHGFIPRRSSTLHHQEKRHSINAAPPGIRSAACTAAYAARLARPRLLQVHALPPSAAHSCIGSSPTAGCGPISGSASVSMAASPSLGSSCSQPRRQPANPFRQATPSGLAERSQLALWQAGTLRHLQRCRRNSSTPTWNKLAAQPPAVLYA
jgi:hypothetical protein